MLLKTLSICLLMLMSGGETDMSNYEDPRDKKSKQVSEFLKKMSEIESSGGRNINHKQMVSGIHKGTAAVGDYGIMPNTALEIGKRHGMEELQGLSPEQAQDLLSKDPELAERIAETMASKLLNKTDEETANYMWQYGHNKEPNPIKVNKADRTRKFRVLSKNEKK